MVSAKRLAQMAKKWQRMAAMGRKRLTRTTTAVKGAANGECCATSPWVAMKGHCMVYTIDGARFEVPLAYLGTSILSELLTMSHEEFGFAGGDDGRIVLPYDATVMEYAMCLLRRDASTEVVKAFMSSVVRPCSFEGSVVGLRLNQQVAVC
ncbi:auxin-responsive protein SAUR36-like [Triticum urartu]|uniref:Auxin-responsive protein SAUR36 n=1 Tax=Triticum urartu TaxID=4572 RepID=A0A8R7UL19_TRIUA|nr:auxin-responsive protein SAUR36-like [Triticum urartu]